MREVEANKLAWSLLAKDHYEHFRRALTEKDSLINSIITAELGDISGKSLLHLQCNTGADTLSLARMGARVTGVDLVPENIHYAKQLAKDFGIDANFIESDVMELMTRHEGKYDIVFTSEGAIGWLPDLAQWGRTIRHFLKNDGFFYAFDSHPFFLAMDEDRFANGELVVKYPYFDRTPDEDDTIGGYASPAREGKSYFWMYTVGDIINSLTGAGLIIEFFSEHDKQFYDSGGLQQLDNNLFVHPEFIGKIPISFSVKAKVGR